MEDSNSGGRQRKDCSICGHRLYCMINESCVNEDYKYFLHDDEVVDRVI